MGKLDIINSKIIKIVSKLSHWQVMESMENRNWEVFDTLSQSDKLYHILEELELYIDDEGDGEE